MDITVYKITYFSAHCISDHCTSNPNPDHDCSHLLVRNAVVRNAVGRKGDHRFISILLSTYYYSGINDNLMTCHTAMSYVTFQNIVIAICNTCIDGAVNSVFVLMYTSLKQD